MHKIGINPISIWFSKFTRFKNHTSNLIRRTNRYVCVTNGNKKLLLEIHRWKINELILLVPQCYQPQMVFRRLVGSMWICGHCKNHWHSCLHEFYYYIHNTKMYTRWVVGYFACVCVSAQQNMQLQSKFRRDKGKTPYCVYRTQIQK